MARHSRHMAEILRSVRPITISAASGIVYGGDRKESPKMQEVKFNYQNITAVVDRDSVRVINKNLVGGYGCISTAW